MHKLKSLMCLAIVSALALAWAVAAEPGSGPGSPIDEPERNLAMERAQQCGMFGVVTASSDLYSGKYVEFRMSGGTLYNYSVGVSKAKVLDIFEISGFGYSSVAVDGATVKVRGAAGDIYAHNNRASILHFSKGSQAPADARLVLAQGVSATALGNGSNIALSGAIDAVLLVENGTSTVSNSTITVHYASAAGCLTLRIGQAGDGAADANEIAKSGAMGGEIDVVAINGTRAEVSQGYCEETRLSVQSAGNGTLRVRVQAEYEHGMIFRIGTDLDTVGAGSADRVRAMLDGESMNKVSAGEMSQYQKENRAEAAYCVQSNGLGCDVLVYVPHFSEHEITIDANAQATTPGFEGLVTVFAVAIAAVAVISYKRRK